MRAPPASPVYNAANEAAFRQAVEQEFGIRPDLNANTFVGSQTGPFYDKGGAEFNVKAFGAVGDGTTDDKASIEAAINAAIAAGGGKVLFPNATYRINGKITVTEVGGSIVHLAGGHRVGATAGPMLQFTGNDAGLEWATNGDSVTISDLVISHTLPVGFDVNTPATQVDLANYGTGITFGTGNYVVLENVWVEYFNVGISFDNFSFYSSMRSVRTVYNYSQGVLVAGAILNGDGFYDCSFSNTLDGPGFEADFDGSVAMAFRSCYFEGNATEGLRANNFITLSLDSCYFEQNAGYDIICENLNPHQPSMLKMDSLYFDVASRNSAGEPRIYLEGTPFIATNCRIYSVDGDGSAPIYLHRGSESSQTSIAYHCVYDSPTLTNIAGDEGIIIIDHKHPYVGFAASQPTIPTSVKAGSVFFNTDEADTATVIGWRCVTAGAGQAQGPNGDAFTGVTASTTNGSKSVTLNVSTHPVVPGDFIEITGVTFGAGESYARVEEVLAGPTLILDRNALATVAGAAMQYRVATWHAITIDGSGFVKAA